MQKTAFPVYTAQSKQIRYKRRGHSEWDLWAPFTALIPFLIIKPADGVGLGCVTIYDAQTHTVVETIPTLNYNMFSDGVNDYIFHNGGTITGLNLPCGRYYWEANGYYSDEWTATDVSQLLKISWRDSGMVGDLVYLGGFRQVAWLKTDVYEPEYPTELEPEKNGFGLNILAFGRVAKVYKILTDLIPEFLMDALALLPLHEEVDIGEYNNVQNVSVRPSSYEGGITAVVEIEFTEEEVVRQTCLNMVFEPISGFDPGGCGQAPDTTPFWVSIGPKVCQVVDGVNTGYYHDTEQDKNPNSPSFGETREVVSTTQNTTLCPIPQAIMYLNKPLADFVQRNDCPEGYEGGLVMYQIAGGVFSSFVSQQEADDAAKAHFEATKQAYANLNATCSLFTPEIIYDPQYDSNGCFNGRMEVRDWTNSMGIPETRQGTPSEYQRYTRYWGNDGAACPILNPEDPI